MSNSFEKWWKPVALILAGIALMGAAWTNGSGLIAKSFLSTDAEVAVAVGVVTKRIDETVDPRIIELAGSVDILTKGQASAELNNLNAALQQADALLFDVRERVKSDPLNKDAKARELQLIRHIGGLTEDQRLAKCTVARLNKLASRC